MEDVSPRAGRGGLRSSVWATAWVLVLCYCLSIFYFSSRAGGQLPDFFLLQHDKVCHFIEYAGLGFLLCYALRLSTMKPRHALFCAFLLALAYGVTDEYHQSFVPGRSGNDPYDLMADCFGGMAGAVLLTLVAGWLQRLGFLGAKR